MSQNSWELFLYFVFEKLCDAFELWEVVCVDQSPISTLHQLVQAPKNFLFLVRYIKEQEAHEVVHPLDVAHFIIIVGIGLQDVVKFVFSCARVVPPKVQIG